MADASTPPKAGFRIFRRTGAGLGETGHMKTVGLDESMLGNLKRLQETQGPDAAETRYLFGGNGMSLCSVWFRSGYPVVLHSHDADCLYYIVAGAIRLGTETLEAGDGFFVPTDVPYTYTAGLEGVELLEFRTAEEFDISFTSRNANYWEKTFANIAGRRDAWTGEPRPARRLPEKL
jgi:hypothetical protein